LHKHPSLSLCSFSNSHPAEKATGRRKKDKDIIEISTEEDEADVDLNIRLPHDDGDPEDSIMIPDKRYKITSALLQLQW
jgi:hypothetical protein